MSHRLCESLQHSAPDQSAENLCFNREIEVRSSSKFHRGCSRRQWRRKCPNFPARQSRHLGCHEQSVGRQCVKDWCRWVRTEADALKSDLLAPMHKATEMVERHLEETPGHWKEGLTTALLARTQQSVFRNETKGRGTCALIDRFSFFGAASMCRLDPTF